MLKAGMLVQVVGLCDTVDNKFQWIWNISISQRPSERLKQSLLAFALDLRHSELVLFSLVVKYNSGTVNHLSYCLG